MLGLSCPSTSSSFGCTYIDGDSSLLHGVPVGPFSVKMYMYVYVKLCDRRDFSNMTAGPTVQSWCVCFEPIQRLPCAVMCSTVKQSKCIPDPLAFWKLSYVKLPEPHTQCDCIITGIVAWACNLGLMDHDVPWHIICHIYTVTASQSFGRQHLSLANQSADCRSGFLLCVDSSTQSDWVGLNSLQCDTRRLTTLHSMLW